MESHCVPTLFAPTGNGSPGSHHSMGYSSTSTSEPLIRDARDWTGVNLHLKDEFYHTAMPDTTELESSPSRSTLSTPTGSDFPGICQITCHLRPLHWEMPGIKWILSHVNHVLYHWTMLSSTCLICLVMSVQDISHYAIFSGDVLKPSTRELLTRDAGDWIWVFLLLDICFTIEL